MKIVEKIVNSRLDELKASNASSYYRHVCSVTYTD